MEDTKFKVGDIIHPVKPYRIMNTYNSKQCNSQTPSNMVLDIKAEYDIVGKFYLYGETYNIVKLETNKYILLADDEIVIIDAKVDETITKEIINGLF